MRQFHDFDGLALFVQIAQAGGLAAAERATQVPKATLSRRLNALEEGLGVRLARRTRQGIILTEAGEDLFERAQRGLGIALDGVGAAQGEIETLSGLCRLSLPPDLASTVLSQPLIDFQAAHPEVRLDISLSDRRVSLIEEGFDLVVRTGGLEDSDLRFRHLGSLPRVLVASPQFMARLGDVTEPADLEQLPGLGIRRDLLRWSLVASDGTQVEVEPRVAFAANRQEILVKAARRGLGVANLPRFLVDEDLATGRLVPVLPGWEPTPVSMSALWARDRLTERLVKKVVSEIARVFEASELLNAANSDTRD